MRGRCPGGVLVFLGLLLSPVGAAAAAQRGSCMTGIIEGSAHAGEGFEKRIGNGLEVLLEPLRSGWILRVVPANGLRGAHDYAELATPPYQSVSPLLLSTDYSFRAQDAVGWNPRKFRFAPDQRSFAAMAAAYARFEADPKSVATMDGLSRLVAEAPEGTLEILEAHLVAGTGDQGRMAAAVASHWSTTPHTLEQLGAGGPSPLGRLTWVRFRIALILPASFRADRGLSTLRASCK